MSNTYNLQLRHGAEAKNFRSREEAIAYIQGQLLYGSVSLLPHEIVLFYYGNDDDKNAIMIVGLPEGKTQNGNPYFMIDTTELKDKVATIDGQYDDAIKALQEETSEIKDNLAEEVSARSEKDDKLQGDLEYSKSDIMSVVEACGLIYNERLSDKRVSYQPDIHDEIIRDANSLADAVAKISKFVSTLLEQMSIKTENTDTVTLTLVADPKSGSNTLSADVNIAGTDGLSKRNFDNNIIGKTNQGLYASASLEPSQTDPNKLIFKTSGYVNGQFKVDAYETEVELTGYKGDNGKKTGVDVEVDTTKNTISAQLNLASDDANILKLVDGEYTVEGLARNIKYGEYTVAQALKNQANRIDELEVSLDVVKTVDIKGAETESTLLNVEKSVKGDFTISSDVKLSTDRSIIISNGGLKADVSASFKKGTSTLYINVGNNEFAIDLSDLAVSVLESAEYDSNTEEIILNFRVGDKFKTLRIPVDKLIHDTEVEDSDTIDLTLRPKAGGPNVIKAELRLDKAHSDNILTINSNGAYVSKAFITDAVKDETDARKEADNALQAKVEEVSQMAKANKEAIVAEAEAARMAEKANKTAIEGEKERATEKEGDLLEKIEKNALDIKTLNSGVDNIELRKVDDLSYALYVNGTKHGELNIPQDQFLKSVEYDTATKNLIFVFKTTDRDITTKVSINDLVDTYEAGTGIVLDGNVFSVDKTIATKTDVETEADRAKNAETLLQEKLDNAEATLTEKLNNEIKRAENAEKLVQETMATKANVADVYTKEEVLNKLADYEKTIDADKKLAEKANVADVYTKVEVLDKLADYEKTSDVDKKLAEKVNVAAADGKYATKTELTELDKLSAKKEDVTASDEALSERIKATEEGLGSLDITYNSATSELSYVDSKGGVHVYKLYSGSLVKGGTFDDRSNSIVLTIETAGTESQITIPVAELLSDVNGRIATNEGNIQKINEALAKFAKSWNTKDSSTISFEKTTVGDVETLTGSVRVATSNKQAIQSVGDGLYVSNDLEDYTCVFGGEGTISAQNAVSKLLESSNEFKATLNILNEKVTKNTSDVEKLSQRVIANESEVAIVKEQALNNANELANVKKKVEAMEPKVDKIESEIAEIKLLIANLTVGGTPSQEVINELNTIKTVTGYDKYKNPKNMSERLDELNNVATQLETLTDKVNGNDPGDVTYEINNIKNNIIGPNDGSVEGSVWAELNNIVDAGTF